MKYISEQGGMIWSTSHNNNKDRKKRKRGKKRKNDAKKLKSENELNFIFVTAWDLPSSNNK